jgi:Fe-Mn family superoxide dismutase
MAEFPVPSRLISRRNALKSVGLGGLALAGLGSSMLRAAHHEGGDMTSVSLPDLPYAFDALEPSIDARTMEIHHDRHHAGYTRKFQAALEELKTDKSVEAVLAMIPLLPKSLQTTVRNNGGGFWNHALFWESMAPAGHGGGGEPKGELAAALKRDFGSFDDFTKAFAEAAGGQFGSGWAWLIHDREGHLKVVNTPNQDNPLMKGVVPEGDLGTPLLGIDVWEHAYYLHYQNHRGDYVKNWWNVVNWDAVAKRFAKA